ncbi:MAG: hypothetical protein JST09_20590 [Bacteroidetes bacterium]|nr:hypothetical protein [Bacteroidota bacterium]
MSSIYKQFFVGIILSISSSCFSQEKDLNTEEKRLLKIYSHLVSMPYGSGSDSLNNSSDEFSKEIRKFIEHNPSTLIYDFPLLSGALTVTTSKDGRLRIYSWDTWTGGTMHFFNQIYQYKDNDKVFTNTPVPEEDDPGRFCSEIYSISINNRKFYMVVSNGIYSTKDASQTISVYTITENKLTDTTRLFKTKAKFLNAISIEYDFFSVVDKPERPVELITYDDQFKTIYIPVVNDKQQVTDNNLIYQLKGNYFEFTGIGKSKQKPKSG